MSSVNFTIRDAVAAVVKQNQDDAQRRWDETSINTHLVPRAIQQLRSDRPDLFFGAYGSEVFKPGLEDPLPFADEGYSAFVEALLALVNESEEESVAQGTAGMADARSERSRRS